MSAFTFGTPTYPALYDYEVRRASDSTLVGHVRRSEDGRGWRAYAPGRVSAIGVRTTRAKAAILLGEFNAASYRR